MQQAHPLPTPCWQAAVCCHYVHHFDAVLFNVLWPKPFPCIHAELPQVFQDTYIAPWDLSRLLQLPAFGAAA